jgi:hypothetical protein
VSASAVKTMKVVTSLLIAVCTFGALPQLTAQTTFVPAGATWRYLDTGVDQGVAWRALGFDDASWASGPAELGYGDDDENPPRPEATVVSYGPDEANKYITTHFRYKFNVVNPATLTNLLLRLVRDDGAVVYLNNAEIFRTNLDTSVVDIAFADLALGAIGGADEATFLQQPISPSLLVAGQNIIAVEMHQSGPASSDLSFDLALVGNYNPVPSAAITSPTNSEVIIASSVSVSASASDPENAVSQVEFYQGTTLIGTDTNAPYSATWTGFSVGNYVLRAVAQDATGLRGTSAPVNVTIAEPPPSLLIPKGSVWKYLDDGSDQGTAWRQPGYDDSSWLSGPAELGYGDGGEATVVGCLPSCRPCLASCTGAGKFATIYFRRKFNVPDPSVYGNLAMEVTYDDGCVIFINGQEAARVRIADDVVVNFDTYIGAGADYTPANVFALASHLVPGENTIAVEMHQSDGGSSDLSFDLRLDGNLAPSVAITSPTANQDIPGPANVTVTADASDADAGGSITQVEFFESGNLVGVSTTPPYSVVLTNVPDGAYVVTARATDNAGGTKLSVPVPFTVSEPVPPTIRSVEATTNLVIITFSKRLLASSAEVPSRYTISGGEIVNTASLSGDLKVVTLGTSALAIGQTYTLTVTGVTDVEGRPIAPNTQTNFDVKGFLARDIGVPSPAGVAVQAGNGYDITAGGAGIAGPSDQFTFQQETRSGDFDVQVRIQGLSLRDAFTKAGLMARENLNANSRYAAVFATPSISGCFFQYRTNSPGNTFITGSAPVNYPNTWLRLQRSNLSNFTGYASLDGLTWVQLGRVAMNLPSAILFGFAASSGTNNNTAVAQFRDFGVTQSTNVAPLVLDREPLGPSTRRGPLVISEIMYHPLSRLSNNPIEFVEIFNASMMQEDIGNYRLSGDVDFTFPGNATIPPGGFILVAENPTALRSYYGLPSSVVIYGPFTNNAGTGTLPNESGTVRLRTELNAVIFEADYLGRNPWPIPADGAGHTLVLARPSYGERDVRAWAASDKIGGSPGSLDPFPSDPARSVVINEILANTDVGTEDFIELYNHSNTEVNLSGCWLTDDRDWIGGTSNMYRFANGTTIPARGYLVRAESDLGFRLSSGGERVYLVNSNQTRVLDAIDYEGQAVGLSAGRYPDGASSFVQLSTPTPQAANSRPTIGNIVINEIFYNPPTDDNDDEFIELYNRGSNSVNVGGWRFTDGVDFTIPLGTIMPSNSYFVVARNIAKLRVNHPSLTGQNSVGNYDGNLDNGGERLAISMPEYIFDTNNVLVETNFIVADEVTYGTGGRWSEWADGGGSSLELIDPDSDNRFAGNWADSDETAKSQWITTEWNGLTANANAASGAGAADALNVILQGPGEFLLDDVQVFLNSAPANNLVTNANFEASVNGWFFQGTHEDSSWHTTEGFNSARSLRCRATRRGDLGANRLRIQLASTINVGQSVTMRCKARWLRGNRFLLMRLRSNIAEAPGDMIIPGNLGTPGARNSRYVANAGPAIYEVGHAPILPAANQPVVVSARVIDPHNVTNLNLVYRLDPGSATTNAMVDTGLNGDLIAGDGIFSATISGQASGVMIAFYIEARDGLGAATRFPNDAPARECLVRFGESQPYGSLGAYRLWFTSAVRTRWESRGKNSNKEMDATFVYNDYRVLYNVGTLYSGSPWHTPSYVGPVGNVVCDYELHPRADDTFLNAEDLVLASVGNNNNDPSGVAEQSSYWIARKMRVPWNYRRFIHMYVLGNRRGLIFEDTQQPNRDVVEQYFPDDSDGPLHKVEDWFEFDASGDGRLGNVDAKLTMITTTNGVKWTPMYRWWWRPRAIGNNSPNDFTELYKVVDALNGSPPEPYTSQTESLVDMEEWMAYFAFQHFVGNWDTYGYRRGKNTYAYKPQNGKWCLLPWDIDFDLGYGTDGDAPNQNPFDTGGVEPRVAFMYTHPPFVRAYWRALSLAFAAGGPLQSAVFDPVINARSRALVANGVTAVDPAVERNYVTGRRAFLQGQMPAASFAVTSATNAVSTTNNYIDVTGTAPFNYHTVFVNGRPAAWTAVTGWSIRVELASGVNAINIVAKDRDGNDIAGSTRSYNVTFNGVAPNPQDFIAITEIMYNPDQPGGAYLELMNRSATHSFDISGWRLDGLDYNFPDSFVLRAGQIAVVAEDFGKYLQYYGTNSALAGTYDGRFNPEGETIALIRPGATPAQDLIIDRVRYEPVQPWPAAANGAGSALQLIDITQDNSRVSNWADGRDWKFFSFTGRPTTNVFMFYMQGAGEVYIDDIWVCEGSVPEGNPNLIQNGGFEAPFAGTWNTNLTTAGSFITTSPVHSGNGALRLHFRNAGGSFLTSFTQTNVPVTTGVVHTLSFWYNYGTNATTMRATLSGTSSSSFNQILSIRPLYGSPGAVNTIAAVLPAYDPIWLNEVLVNNTIGTNDNMGEREPWIELFNRGAAPIDLSNYFLSDDYGQLNKWAFPPGTTLNPGHRLIWADGEAGETSGSHIHTSFRLTGASGSIALSRSMAGGQFQIVDYLNYSGLAADTSYGDIPDGQPFTRQVFYTPSPARTNTAPPVSVFINEWMAANQSFIADPSDNRFDDWFELYNGHSFPVDLSGYFLTDDTNNTTQFEIPAGTVIPARGFLLVWADNDQQDNGFNDDLHVNFELSRTLDHIRLYGPDEVTLISSVTFSNQVSNVSQGRFADGTPNIVFFNNPTPGSANTLTANTAPTLSAITDKIVTLGQTLTFTASASDSDVPPQTLSFSLDAAPPGATIGASSGLFSWAPTAGQVPSTNAVTVRVTDSGSPPMSATQGFTVRAYPPPLAGISHAGGSVSLTFSTIAGKTYRVEYRNDLNPGPWSQLGDPAVAVGNSITINDTIGAQAQRFYRIVQLD